MNERNKKITLWSVIAGLSFALIIVGTILVVTAGGDALDVEPASGFERVQNFMDDVR